MPGSPLRDREQRERRAFVCRALILCGLMFCVAYLAWFSAWARPVSQVLVELAP